jgi:CheY-like chemotaxis protein
MSSTLIILIADRNEDAVKYLKEQLAPMGISLLHAKDGQEALAIIEQAPDIAAAVVELELPLVNGFDLIGRLTAKQPRPKRIIATTFLEHGLLFELAQLMGADEIVRKLRPEYKWVGKLRRLLPESMKDAPLQA